MNSLQALLCDFCNNSTIFIQQDHSLTKATIRYTRIEDESENLTEVVVQSPQNVSYDGQITQR